MFNYLLIVYVYVRIKIIEILSKSMAYSDFFGCGWLLNREMEQEIQAE